MNERIKELTEQAWNDTDITQDIVYKMSFTERFAELIVRECSDILRTEADSNWEGREERLLNAMANWIEQHFGIE